MKLYLNETSPFSRVAVMMALLTEQDDMQLEWVDPWENSDTFLQINPFSTIPALVLADGNIITESLCICEYFLQSTSQHNALFDAKHLPLLGLAKTLMELAFRTSILKRFYGEDSVLEVRGKEALMRALSSLEENLSQETIWDFSGNDYPALYMMTALEYVQFRHQDLFEAVNPHNIKLKMQQSHHKAILDTVSLEALSLHPSFNALQS